MSGYPCMELICHSLRYIPIGAKDKKRFAEGLSDGKETGGQMWIDAMYDYADGLTDAQVIELNCGHMVTEEKPDEIAAAMRAFFAGLDE